MRFPAQADARPAEDGRSHDGAVIPDATFLLDGRLYRVCRHPVAAPDNNGGREGWQALENARVGSALIGGDRYIIVPESLGPTADGAGARDPVEVLTPRELQIAALVARGCANKEIAVRLRISGWTVSTHLRRIFAKLGVDSRAAMVFRCAATLEEFEVR
jgi:DNA-binding CsgD family transcriptional regulator